MNRDTPDLDALQRKILFLLAQGSTEVEVGAALGLKKSSITDRMKTIRSRLGAKNATHAVYLAVRAHLLEDSNGE